MTIHTEQQHELNILEKIEQDPETTQASLAAQLGVAVGTVNWHLKRMIDKGYVKVRRTQRRKLRYIITPDGVSRLAYLTLDYINSSFKLFRLVRDRMITALKENTSSGTRYIKLNGDGDVSEVCRLTCIEQGFIVVTDENLISGKSVAEFNIVGLKIFPQTSHVQNIDDTDEKSHSTSV